MRERIKQSKVVVRRGMLLARVVLDRDGEIGDYRTYLEIIARNGDPAYSDGRIFKDHRLALEDFVRQRL